MMTSFEARFSECFHKHLPQPLPRKAKRSSRSRLKRNAPEASTRKDHRTPNGLLPFASELLPPVLLGLMASEASSTSVRPPKALLKRVTSASGTPLVPLERKRAEGREAVSLRGQPDGQDAEPQAMSKRNSPKSKQQSTKEKKREGVKEKKASNADNGRVQKSNAKEKSAGLTDVPGKGSQERVFENVDASVDNKLNENIVHKLEGETRTNAVENEPQNGLGNSSGTLMTVGSEDDKQKLPQDLLKSREEKSQGLDEARHAEGPVQQQRSQRKPEVATDVGKGAEGHHNNEFKSANLTFEVPPVNSISPDSLMKKNSKKHSDKETLPNGNAKNGEHLEASPTKRGSTVITKYKRREERHREFGCKTRIPIPKPSFQLSIKTSIGNLEVTRGKGFSKTHQQGHPASSSTARTSPRTRSRRSVSPRVRRSLKLPAAISNNERVSEDRDLGGCRKKGKDTIRDANQDSNSIPCVLIGDSPSPQKKPKSILIGAQTMDREEDEVVILSPLSKQEIAIIK